MKLMRHKRMVSIFQHYFLILTSLVLFCLLISSLSLMLFVATTWSDDLQKKMTDGCNFIVNEIMLKDPSLDYPLQQQQVYSIMHNLMQSSDVSFFICDEAGNIMICSDSPESSGSYLCRQHEGCTFAESIITFNESGNSEFFHKGTVDIDRQRDYMMVAVRDETPVGEPFYVISMQLLSSGYQPYITQYLKMTIAASCVAVVMAFFCSLAVTYRIVRPLRKMSVATKHYAAGDFSYRIKNVGKYEEFNELAAAFNLMAKNLEEYEISRRNFVANVSHELKTPMTTISGFIDGILDGTIPPEKANHYLNIVSDVVKHLSGLVVSMLNMSKIEAGKVELEFSQFSLDQLLIQVLVGFEKNITDKKIDVIGLEKLDSITIRADEALIRQVLYNLLDNAVKFTKTEGSIKVSLSEQKHNVELVITNSGSTIPEDDLNNIFERFYKVDKSRGLDASSFGLGLYIVKGIIEMHGGSISAESHDNNTKFIVILPLFNNV